MKYLSRLSSAKVRQKAGIDWLLSNHSLWLVLFKTAALMFLCRWHRNSFLHPEEICPTLHLKSRHWTDKYSTDINYMYILYSTSCSFGYDMNACVIRTLKFNLIFFGKSCKSHPIYFSKFRTPDSGPVRWFRRPSFWSYCKHQKGRFGSRREQQMLNCKLNLRNLKKTEVQKIWQIDWKKIKIYFNVLKRKNQKATE